ncbi:hypothetical protein Pcinc_044056 [Petrolisthes cinctipes]|uniref:Ubiquitin-conjugating enzyme E2 J2 n=1 Tax=Petrolisthes cinctipes TaxID=88211 RepID=A0AAE1EEK8_PETCI|nr:hypothetical protein Pcinc_044056 [Petrolisthes cinctipes]
MRIKRDPVPYVTAEPLPSNILEWHYVVEGPEESPYEGGYYHGKLVFPMEYPFRPPSIYMITPSGRFKTNTRLCLSISDFHPDTWNPAWSVATILTGLLSFMLEKSPTFGSIETVNYEKRQLSQQSLSFNLKDKVFTELFPEITEAIQNKLAQREQELAERAKALENGNPSERDASTNDSRKQNPDAAQMSALTNLLVVVGFAVFAWTVRYIVSTLSEEEG